MSEHIEPTPLAVFRQLYKAKHLLEASEILVLLQQAESKIGMLDAMSAQTISNALDALKLLHGSLWAADASIREFVLLGWRNITVDTLRAIQNEIHGEDV